MDPKKDISQFKRRWLTLSEAAVELQTDEEGLLQTFESGDARALPVYVHSDRNNFSGMCRPIRFAHQLSEDNALRKSVSDECGMITTDPQRKRREDWERWFQLVGAFRIFPSSLKRIARERTLGVCRVAPGSWWTSEGLIPRNAAGDPRICFDVLARDGAMGQKPVNFDRIRIKVADIWSYTHRPDSSDEPTTAASSKGVKKAGGKWPWGDHETDQLRNLEAAATKFWKNHDFDRPDTLHTNDEVRDWLIAEREMNTAPAAYMASFLRPNNIKPGPRRR